MSSEFIPISKKQIARRRLAIFGLMFVSTLLATFKWIEVIPNSSLFITQFLMTALFILTFAWIALFFWSSLFGFWQLLKQQKTKGIIWPDKKTKITTKYAFLFIESVTCLSLCISLPLSFISPINALS